MPENAHWQVQEAKQRFSEYLRAVQQEGPQTVTKHGEEIAVTIDINEYRRLTQPQLDFKQHLMAFPKMESDGPDIWDEIEAERKRDFGRPIDLGASDDINEPR